MTLFDVFLIGLFVFLAANAVHSIGRPPKPQNVVSVRLGLASVAICSFCIFGIVHW